MSERYNVAASAVLGENYKITNIECSDYNPTIDSDIIVTVTLEDVYEDPVASESITITATDGTFTTVNGTSITAAATATGTTDSNGQVTLTYNCSEWGLITFTSGNVSTQVLVDGWRYVGDSSSSSSYAFLRNKTHARFLLRGWTNTGQKDTEWGNFGAGNYATSIRPNATVNMRNTANSAWWYIDTSGNVKWKGNGSNVSANTSHYGSVEWAIHQ